MPKKTIHSAAYRRLTRLLRDRRVELGMTQSQVAAKLGRSRSWLQKVEGAKPDRRLDFLQTVDLLRVLKIELDEAERLVMEKAP
jgi:transcriptional regulator with XRE-family HTH domain